MRTVKQCNAAIQQIKITGKGLDEAVQSVGLDVLQHVAVNREVSLAIKLLAALPKGSRRNALIEWFTQYGMIAVNLDKATAKQFPLLFNNDGKTDLEGAVAKQWWACRPERPAAEEFDFAGQLAALIQRAQAAQAKGLAVKGLDALNDLVGVPSTPAADAEDAAC